MIVLSILTLLSTAAAQAPAEYSSIWASLSKEGVLPSDAVIPSGGPPAAWTSAFSSLKSAGIIPSHITAPAAYPTGMYGPGYGPWVPGHPYHDFEPEDACGMGPGGGRRWGDGPGDCGPWGPGKWGPWSEWASQWKSGDWKTRDAPWTKWWGGTACPGPEWPGWTEGEWKTGAPWTKWEGCTCSTTGSSLLTTTVSGKEVTTTAFGVKVASAVDSNTLAAQPTKIAGAANGREVVAMGAVVVGLVGGVLAL
ncbi:hypothetical protein M011DRAFT_407386 [Sporormia fimetaria CBS 119925]|uniref:Uncharacterized protein n=1 Tax=Sporormia fimetaria CBS 119925 TaxID=1340428 RepID=A0A6A6V2X2_9PLEO|nr:hypothetical protein M011DRAFT_407386 [Sporormia fimetaria CBS 119925]